MWPRWLTALLMMLQEAWSARRDAQIRFLKLQVEILRARRPGNRVIPDPVERQRLLKLGAEIRCQRWLGGLLSHCYRQAA